MEDNANNTITLPAGEPTGGEKPAKPVSQQRAWQLARIRSGLCQGCGKEPLDPSSRAYGAKCIARRRLTRGTKRHNMSGSQWATIDLWAEPADKLAKRLGVAVSTVYYRRKRQPRPAANATH